MPNISNNLKTSSAGNGNMDGFVAKDAAYVCMSLDIQSYLLRFGVWLVNLGSPNTFSAGVWMSRV